MKLYLTLYNLCSAVGWAYVLYLTVTSYLDGLSASEYFEATGHVTKVVSRLWPVWVVTGLSTAAQQHWSYYLMVGSWSLVEIPRYLYYAVNLHTKSVPFPLFWLRYSLFAVLYPTGISGELLQFFQSLAELKESYLTLWYISCLAIVLYIPGSPFMYFHMLGQRKRAFRSRNPPPARPLAGLEFPLSDKEKNLRSTTVVNKGTFAAAIAAVDKNAAATVEKEKNWRWKYGKYIVANVKKSLESTETALKVAEAGLEYLHSNFEFHRDGKITSLAEAMATVKDSFHTGVIKGTKSLPTNPDYVIPYHGKDLKGPQLIQLVDRWVSEGVIEPDAGEAIKACAENPGYLDLSDRYFVLLGAGSAMGPLPILLSFGAQIIAVDLDRSGIWERLITMVRNSPGTMHFPLKKEQSELKDDADLFESAGCNLFTQTPEIANWLATVAPGKAITIGGYAYLDGALFVKVALAMDAIMKGVYENRDDVTLAFLCTPTDCHVMTKEAYVNSGENLKNAPFYQKILANMGFLKKNQIPPITAKDGTEFVIVNALQPEQGPNYALAKRMQHWRAIVARSKGVHVSSNIAPSTATQSVLSRKAFAAVYKGMHLFKPMEVFYQETSNAVMGALLIHDVNNKKGPAQATFPLENPLAIFSHEACHGGNWRTAYTMESFGKVSFIAGMIKIHKIQLTGLAAVGVAFASAIYLGGAPHTWF